jgi:hypothetical protein
LAVLLVGRLSNLGLSFKFDIIIVARLGDCLVGRYFHSEDRRTMFFLNLARLYQTTRRQLEYHSIYFHIYKSRALSPLNRVLILTLRLSQIAFSNIFLHILNSPTSSLPPPGFQPEVLAYISYVLAVLYTSTVPKNTFLLFT